MVALNGAAQIAAHCSRARSIPSASGFFELFYRWSQSGCWSSSSRNSARCLHTKTGRQLKYHSIAAGHPLRIQRRQHSSSAVAEAEAEARPRIHVEEPQLSTHLRKIMRTLPHSVVVLTTCTSPKDSAIAQGSDPLGSTYRGMALSSFTTLTLTPSPIITFNIRQPSRTLDALRESKHFLIHILEANRAGSKVAHGFTQGGGGVGGFKDLEVTKEHVVLKETEEELVLPRLNGDGIMQALRCEVLRDESGECKGMIKVGDHMLVLAEVTEILGNDPSIENPWHGLCYADGRYRLIGETIEVEPLDDLTVQ